MVASLPKSQTESTPMRPALWPILWNHRLLIAGGLFLGLLVGGAFALSIRVTYTSASTLLFSAAPMARLSALAGAGGSGDPSVPVLDGLRSVPQPGASAATATVILQSRRVRENVITALRPTCDLERAWGLDHEFTLRRLQDYTKLKAGKQGELYITFSDPDPQRAHAVVTAFLAELDALTEELKLNPARDNERFLQERQQKAQARVTAIQQEIMEFQKAHRIISLPDQAKALAEKYSDLENQVVAAQLDADVAERAASIATDTAARLIKAAVDPVPGSSNTLGTLYQKVTTLRTEKAMLLVDFTEKDPGVQAKQRELELAEQGLADEVQRQAALLQPSGHDAVAGHPAVIDAVTRAILARAKLATARGALERTRDEVDHLPEQQATWARLTAEADGYHKEVELLTGELEKAHLIAESRGPLYQVLDPPLLPTRPDAAHRLQYLLTTTMLGLLLGLALPYRRWRREEDAYLAARRKAMGAAR